MPKSYDVTVAIDTTDTVQVWTEQARDTWQKMVFHVADLGRHYGSDSKEYTAAAASLAHISGSLVGWGSMRVMKDMDDLSLLCDTTSITFGLIWHGTRRSCTVEGCNAYINDDGHAWAYNRDLFMCDDHQPSFPLDAPHAGTWSFHS